MAIQFNCQCGRSLNFPDQQAGQQARCMYCGKAVTVPGLDGSVPAAPQGVRVVAVPKQEQDLSLQAPTPKTHAAPVSNVPPDAPPPGFKPPVHRGPAPGLGIGKIVFWGVIATVVGLLILGGYSMVHWWHNEEYEGLLRGGDDWLEKGYLTDAEIHYKKAKKIFPSDPRTKDAFERLAIAVEDKKRRGTAPNAILGPIVSPGIMPVDAQRKMMEAQNLQFNKEREMQRRMREMEDPGLGPPGRPLTPQELEARKMRDEAARKAREAKRKAYEAKRAEDLAKRQEEERLEAEERKRKMEEAKKAADERQRLFEEARKAQQEAAQQRTDQANLERLQAWSSGLLEKSADTYKKTIYWSRSSIPDSVVSTIMRTLADDAQNEEVTVRAPSTLETIAKINDANTLGAFYKDISRQLLQAQDAEVAGRNAKVVARNQLSMSIRQFEKLTQQETPLKRDYSDEARKKKAALLADKEKLVARMRPHCTGYSEGLNKFRGAKAARQLLEQAKELAAARLKELGADPGTTAAPATTKATPPKTKTYVLKNGTEIKAVTVAAMGDELLIKDVDGEMHTVKKADVKVIH